MPALLTMIETAPNSFAMPSTSASTAAASVTFNTRPCPFPAASRSPIATAPPLLVAVPMTVAPIPANSSAIAAPMPRLAPVTRAISPCSGLFMGRAPRDQGMRCREKGSVRRRRACGTRSGPFGACGLELGRGADRACLDAFVDTLDQAAQHLARPALGSACSARRRQGLYALGPANRQIQLSLQGSANFPDRGVAARLGILDHRDDRQLPVDRSHVLSQPIGGVAHQRAMQIGRA